MQGPASLQSIGRAKLNAVPIMLCVYMILLSGCAASLDEGTFFVDPARFALYNCKELTGYIAGISKRVEELRGLMSKAEAAAGGSVIAEIAYRPDYVSAQGSLKAAQRAWEANRCAIAQNESLARPKQGEAPPAGSSRTRIY